MGKVFFPVRAAVSHHCRLVKAAQTGVEVDLHQIGSTDPLLVCKAQRLQVMYTERRFEGSIHLITVFNAS